MDIPFVVNFVFLSQEGEEILDKQFQARCFSIPRKGELVIPMSGSAKVVVTDVFYTLIESEAFPGQLMMVPTVVLEEPDASKTN